MNLNWMKCSGQVWCNFYSVNLEHPNFGNPIGVYVIWSGKNTVYVGSGILKQRIEDHRTDPRFKKHVNLKVTWAKVEENKMRNVEKYLALKLQPLIGERHPDVQPISVNWPWE